MKFINIRKYIIKYQRENRYNINYYIKAQEMDWMVNIIGPNAMDNLIY